MTDEIAMARYAMLLEFEGSEFAGWQIQPRARTVQGELQSAFQTLVPSASAIVAAGRTDAGVHAAAMVAHINMPRPGNLEALRYAINSTTGQDVVVRAMQQVPSDFHARFSALSRRYLYRINSERTAMNRRTEAFMHKKLDFGAMEAATAFIVGEHDFTSFSKSSLDVDHFRCKVTEAAWRKRGTCFEFSICANRFVRGMVRALVGSLVRIGTGQSTVNEFEAMLKVPNPSQRAKFLAPAKGLTFVAAEYPNSFELWPHINES